MSFSSLFSSVFGTVHADAPEEKEVKEAQEEPQEEPQEEEEAEEPEDPFPELQEQCANTAKCAPFQKHFAHCEEKVNAGEGFKGEDCVEEFLMHCVNGCAAPKLFAQLK
ncbi:hypothetical protein C8Q74DRAFT_1372686 [Fomes fomentarius]|nr:hypothetical protein C8Q74DRAFT_1372686 [Fomes fomentarius]